MTLGLGAAAGREHSKCLGQLAVRQPRWQRPLPRSGSMAPKLAARCLLPGCPHPRPSLRHQPPTCPAYLCHVALVVQGAQVVEQLQGAHEGLGGGGVHEVKVHLHGGERVGRGRGLSARGHKWTHREPGVSRWNGEAEQAWLGTVK